jgi:hypothetical protein
MTNIRNIKSTSSAQVEIKDETGAPTGVFFELAGPTHPKRKAVVFAAARKAQSQYQKSGKLTLDDPEEQVLQGIDNLTAWTLGWSGYTDDAGAAIAFTPAAAKALYEDDSMAWLVDQLNAALNEKERFMQRCATA